MRVKFITNVFVRGQDFKEGEEYEIDNSLAEWLKGYYEVIDKAIEEPPEDKQIKKSKNK
jgi:hypothetical protein